MNDEDTSWGLIGGAGRLIMSLELWRNIDMNKSERQVFSALMRILREVISHGSRRATAYLTPGCVITATANDWCRGNRPRKNARTRSLVLKWGAPNYRERKFIRLLLAVGEPFPVKKIQIESGTGVTKGG